MTVDGSSLTNEGIGERSGQGLAIDNRTTGQDLRLIRRAIRQRWGVNDSTLETLPDTMDAMAKDVTIDARARVGAAKVIIEMVKQNNEEIPEEPSASGKQTINVGVVVNNQRSGEEAVFD